MSETIDFKFNTPQVLTLAFPDGKPAPSRYPGSIRIMRSTTDKRVFFCDPQLEGKIKALNPAPGVQVEITKLERDGGKGFDWKVSRVGQQQDGTYQIPKAEPANPSKVADPAPDHQRFISASTASQSTTVISPQNITAMPPKKGPTESESHCYRLVDLMAATMQYAKEKPGGLVREDDARAIAITVYIQSAKMGIIKRRPVQTRRAG